MASLGLLVQFISTRSSLLLAAVADLCVCTASSKADESNRLASASSLGEVYVWDTKRGRVRLCGCTVVLGGALTPPSTITDRRRPTGVPTARQSTASTGTSLTRTTLPHALQTSTASCRHQVAR